MAVYVYLSANESAARHVKAQAMCRRVNAAVTMRAKDNLSAANTTERITKKGYFKSFISSDAGRIDHYTHLNAPNAVALEFGHDPSGWFSGTDTKPPAPTYILTRAAVGGVMSYGRGR